MPTDESMYCDDFGRASTAQLHSEGRVDDPVSVKEEADEADATSTSEGSDCEDIDDPSSSPEPASGVQRATVGVEKGKSSELSSGN
ncbi:hypothetical protein HPB47_002758 [Ixodes persulcatus]|uniref:Uncharacterized protein n=1 Tax=Ixodes persulcatus TaxID=34615 RepID=A0AC60PKL3_IXOPE|nr:hypothetical protein HPB47_002758 [Ixodes persulcatus]